MPTTMLGDKKFNHRDFIRTEDFLDLMDRETPKTQKEAILLNVELILTTIIDKGISIDIIKNSPADKFMKWYKEAMELFGLDDMDSFLGNE